MSSSRSHTMLALAAPALLVGVGSALILLVVVIVANLLQRVLWNVLPPMFGATPATWWWILGMLTVCGLVVGLVAKFVPGHAGPDPATVSLFGPPMPLVVLPGLALVLVLMLAGGVSLGPENPIVAIVIGLTVAIGTRLMPKVPVKAWVILAVAGIIGAMFGTPVAAALLLSEIFGGGENQPPLWDRMFAPLLAAGAGAVTMTLFEAPNFALPVEPYGAARAIDLLTGTAIVLLSCGVGMLAVWLFLSLHRLFVVLPQVLALTLGGFLLGLLGIVGGPLTMFKGLGEMKTMVEQVGNFGVSALAIFLVVRLLATVIAGTCGFRGGRIFPMVAAGATFGLLVHSLIPAIPLSLSLACAIMGFTLVATRDGWLSLFLAAAMVPGPHLLPLLCLMVLPAWFVMAGRAEMIVKTPAPRQGEAAGPASPAAKASA
ncbi:ion channel protein [Ramlibacter sp. G-1-2-2]|uniref:Ion channel protein n=1 Tax=Ramlibacter agri TaxID=2728837 RepID=A0A848H9F8_9BURK|nr:ion channel protein [Ramlibacter agri]NML44278.1 ion channel protein [Ramlibacter agri]